MSTLKTNTLSNVAGTASTAIENAINGSAKAWVNFNGTGTVAIRASYNVSSITDNGVGTYTVNFTTALADSTYALAGSSTNTSSVWMQALGFFSETGQPQLKTTTQAKLFISYTGGNVDTEVSAVFFR